MLNESKRINKIFEILKKEYPNTKPQLEFTNPLELLIATILSAQCTDARVNIVTKDLFKNYKTAEEFAAADQNELEKFIFSTGFYKQKAKSIIKCCKILIEKYNSKVPDKFDELIKLPGVGRKTASVVSGHAFQIPAIAVDTHVNRISNLLGIVNSKNPEIIEMKLKELLPKEDWINSTHWFINHGRKICVANRPKCENCVVEKYCVSSKLKRG
ncbi:MAG: endonuclease III [Ignavibacteriales bacterium]|nr:endonuclease III [Ignavibacteriales bacterium]